MERAAAHYRRDLKKLTESVTQFLHQLDGAMALPSTVERGKKVALLSNALEMINDGVRYGALGIDFRKDRKSERYKKHTAFLEAAQNAE